MLQLRPNDQSIRNEGTTASFIIRISQLGTNVLAPEYQPWLFLLEKVITEEIAPRRQSRGADLKQGWKNDPLFYPTLLIISHSFLHSKAIWPLRAYWTCMKDLLIHSAVVVKIEINKHVFANTSLIESEKETGL